MDNSKIISTVLAIDIADFDIATFSKWTRCLIGITDIKMGDQIQKVMLPSYQRQLILIDTNFTNNESELRVHKFHHPIAVFSERNEKLIQSLACRDGHREITNHYRDGRKSWTLPYSMDSLSFERVCNAGHHPLHGMFMKGSTFGPEPFIEIDIPTLEIIGGVSLDIFDTLANYFRFDYSIKYSNNWYIFKQDGSIGGSLGDVVMGDYDFSLEQGLNMGLGKHTSFTYYSETNFFELKPKKLSAVYNIVFTFDRYIWVFLLVSFMTISVILYLMYKLEDKSGKVTFTQVLGMSYGNMFQEYNKQILMKTGKMSTKLHIMWIITTTFLSMAFVGNLKSSLVRNEYEPRTFTLSEMIDKDMLVTIPNTLEMFLEMDYSNSVINNRILCQARETNGVITVEGDYFQLLFDQLLAKGGATNFIEKSVLVLEKQYHQKNKDFPLIMIPDTFMTWPLGILFKNYDFRVQYLNPVIIRIRDMGIIEHYFSKWEGPKNMKEHVVYAEEPLVMSHFLVVLVVWSVGLVLSVSLFMGEHLLKCGKKEV